MKLAIWATAPSPHQADFYEALRSAGADLRVCYFKEVSRARRELGWRQPATLPDGELMTADAAAPLAQLPDWHERIHVLPGYSRRISLQLAWQFSRAGVPWVHWSENSQPSWRAALTWSLQKLYAQLVNRSALGAFAVGDAAVRDFVRWGVRPEMIAHLYYAVRGIGPETSSDAATAKFTRGKLAFVFAGTVNRNKATRELVQAFADAVGSRRDAVLVIVGDGPDRSACERLAVRLGIGDRVLFRGVVAQPAVCSVMKCCQVAVLPSRYDGWGVMLNEAASAGLALVASTGVGAAEHLIGPGVNGFQVERGSIRSFSEALRAYIADRQLAAAHGAASLQRFEAFTPELNASRLIAAVRTWLAASDAWHDWPNQVRPRTASRSQGAAA